MKSVPVPTWSWQGGDGHAQRSTKPGGHHVPLVGVNQGVRILTDIASPNMLDAMAILAGRCAIEKSEPARRRSAPETWSRSHGRPRRCVNKGICQEADRIRGKHRREFVYDLRPTA
jgi:hypothetical protein